MTYFDEVCLRQVRAVGAAYRPNPYHNFRHGVHVLHSTAALLRSDAAKHVASNHLESFPLLMAALAHDVDHPGRTNSFEIAKQSELALCYSDDSVLERHHAATTSNTQPRVSAFSFAFSFSIL